MLQKVKVVYRNTFFVDFDDMKHVLQQEPYSKY